MPLERKVQCDSRPILESMSTPHSSSARLRVAISGWTVMALQAVSSVEELAICLTITDDSHQLDIAIRHCSCQVALLGHTVSQS